MLDTMIIPHRLFNGGLLVKTMACDRGFKSVSVLKGTAAYTGGHPRSRVGDALDCA